MTVTISRLYDSYTAALEAVRNLESAGVPHSDISIVSTNPRTGILRKLRQRAIKRQAATILWTETTMDATIG